MSIGLDGCIEGAEAFRRIRERARASRVPVSASLALTHRCNLACVHCYARTSADAAAELDTRTWRECIDKLADAGTLFLVLTGGEPLLRPDFAEIYTHAKRRGFLVGLFTNATPIDDAAIALFRDLPPRMVDVTLYGMSEATTRRVTGVPGVHDRCWNAIRRLRDAGIPVGLKTVLMTLNRHDYPAMQAAAGELGVPLRLDVGIFPRYDGDRTPTAVRLPPDEAAAIEFGDQRRADDWKALQQRCGHVMQAGPLYRCGAARTHVHVAPDGMLQPCVMTSHIRAPLIGQSFAAAWAALGRDLDARQLPANSACIGCEKQILCGYCPGFSRLDTGNEAGVSDYLCALGTHRLRHVTGET